MVVRLYAFFSEQTVRMATPNRSAVRNALAKLVQAHMNLENTASAKNNLKRVINNHLSATINRNKAINHVLKKQGYKYSNANRANIVQRVNINANKQLNMTRLSNLYNIKNNKTIQKRPIVRRMRNMKQKIPGLKKAWGNLSAWYQQPATTTPTNLKISLNGTNNRSGAAVRNNNSGATVAGG